MGLYTTSERDLHLTGFRQTDVVVDARPGRGSQEYVVLAIEPTTRTVKVCRITPSGRPGRNAHFQPEDLVLVSRVGS